MRDSGNVQARFEWIGVFIAVAAASMLGCGTNISGEPVVGIVVEPAMVTIERENDNDQMREVIFRLHNKTSSTVQIGKLQSSCSCTVAKPLTKKTLFPNDEVEIFLSVSIPSQGEQESILTVETDCPQSPSIALVVIARGLRKLPPYFYRQTNRVDVVVRNPEDGWADLYVDTVESSADHDWVSDFSVSSPSLSIEVTQKEVLHRLPDNGLVKRYRFRVSVEKSALGGDDITAWFTASPSDASKFPPIPLFFRFERRYTVVPAVIRFESQVGEGSQVQKLTVFFSGDEDWSCEPVDVPTFVNIVTDSANPPLPLFAKRFSISLSENPENLPKSMLLRFMTSISPKELLEVPLVFGEAQN